MQDAGITERRCSFEQCGIGLRGFGVTEEAGAIGRLIEHLRAVGSRLIKL